MKYYPKREIDIWYIYSALELSDHKTMCIKTAWVMTRVFFFLKKKHLICPIDRSWCIRSLATSFTGSMVCQVRIYSQRLQIIWSWEVIWCIQQKIICLIYPKDTKFKVYQLSSLRTWLAHKQKQTRQLYRVLMAT